MFKPSILAAAVAACSSLPVIAETILPTQVITASRLPTEIRDTLSSVHVIRAETLEKYQGRDVGEILRFEAGLDIVRSGGPGGQTSTFMRGTNSNHTLIMIDGVRINPGTSTIANIQHLTTGDIERIEVVKGPLSSLYGSDAVGGVVNIITRSPDKTQTQGDLTAGSRELISGGLSQSIKSGNFAALAQVNSVYSDGYRIIEGNDAARSHHNTGSSIKTQYDLGQAVIELAVRDNRGSTEYINQSYPPPTFIPVDALLSQDFLNQIISLSLTGDLTPRVNSRLRLSQMKDEIDQNQSASFAHTRQTQADWQTTFSISPHHTLLAGITSSKTEAGYADQSVYDKSTHSEALYLQNQWQAGAANLQVALRHERYSTYGNQDTGSLAFGYAINAGHRVYANIGTAFHAPDLNQLYDASYGSNNPDLQPEKSRTVEIGSRHQLGDLALDLSLFDTSLKNLIASKNFVLFNISEAGIKGGEMGARWTMRDGWYLSGNASYTKAINKITNKELDRRPRRSLTLGGGYQLKDWGVSADILAKGHSEDFGGRLDGYAVANVSGYWQASPMLKLRLNLENLGDKHYGVAHYDTDRLFVATPFTASLSAHVTF